MNRTEEKGLGKQVKGTVKDIAGKATGDKFLEHEGKVERGIGKVQEKVGEAKRPQQDRPER